MHDGQLKLVASPTQMSVDSTDVMSHFQVAREMLEERGHAVTVAGGDDDKILATSGDGGIVFVKFIPQKLSINLLKEILSKYDINLYSEFIIVAKSIMASNAKKIMKMNSKIEIFVEAELSFNIMRHYLQPRMRKIPLVKKDCYPVMLETDAVAKFMKWTSGDFIEITNSNNMVTYRLVKSVP
jgi:DNA-directed RNA polymerase subunit H (RpoH/RPB5)